MSLAGEGRGFGRVGGGRSSVGCGDSGILEGFLSRFWNINFGWWCSGVFLEGKDG